MKVKVIGFYELFKNQEKKILKGSCHVYLEELGVDLRGVRATFTEGKPWIELPCLFEIDKKTKKKVKFPVLQFSDREKTLELRRSVYNAVKDYVTSNILKKKDKTNSN